MKRISNLWCILLFLGLSNSLGAQSIKVLVEEAIVQNLELKILEQEYLVALERAPQVSEMPDPELGIGLFPFPVETRLGPQYARLSATQMFPWFGLLDSKKQLELAKAKALYERIAARQLILIYEIEVSWFQLYELQESQKIIQRNIELLNSLERLALSKVESGKATAADVLRVQLKIRELEEEINILELAKIKPLAEINQLLNRSSETAVTISDSLVFQNLPFSKDTLAANIKDNHPTLRMFELQQDISRQATVLNELSGKPSFGVGLDYIMVGKRGDANPSRNGRDIVQLRASVKIPLYRKKYAAKEREEQLKIAVLDHKKEDLLSKFNSMIEQAFANYEMTRIKKELYEQQINLTRAAINILETDYSARGNNFDELLRLEKELINYDLKMLKIIVESHIARSSIKRFILQK